MPPQATADAEGAPEVIWLKYTGARPDKWQHFIAAHCRCNNRERDAARLLEWERRPFRGGCKCEARRDGPRQRQARRNAADGDGRQAMAGSGRPAAASNPTGAGAPDSCFQAVGFATRAVSLASGPPSSSRPQPADAIFTKCGSCPIRRQLYKREPGNFPPGAASVNRLVRGLTDAPAVVSLQGSGLDLLTK
jgi:hypothetical protein